MAILSLVLASAAGAADEPEYFYFESFEGGFAEWSRYGGTRADPSSDLASHGSSSARVEDTSTSSGGGLRSSVITLEKNKYYDITVDVYNDSGNANVFIEFWNGTPNTSTLSNRISNVSSTATETGRWTTLTFSVMVPNEATGTTILLYSGVANKGISYFDNVIVKEEAADTEQTIKDFEIREEAHPRLYFNAGELETLKSLADEKTANACGFIGDKVVSSLIADADALLTKSSFSMTYYSTTTVNFAIPFEEKHFASAPSGYSGSNYPYWQEMGNEMKEMMQTLSLAYALTGEAKYADRAIALMDSLCAWTTWTEHPTINRTSLETGYFTVGVATVYDICYDRLSETQKTNALTALENLGLSKLYADLSAFTDHNYYVNKATALAIGSCLVLDTDTDAERYLSRAYEYIDWYLEERSKSESQEGLSYTSYSIDLISSALDTIKRVTGDNSLMASEYMETVFVWAAMAADNANGYGPEISDFYSNTYFYTTACVMNREQGNALAGWYVGSRTFSVSDFTRIVYYCADMKSETPDEYTARTGVNLKNGVIPSIGWGTLRTGWEDDDMLLVCVANNSSQGHSHYDQNSFVLSLGSGWLLGDPGYQDYGGGYKSDYSLSYGHSTIYVDGKSQDYKGKSTLETLIDSSAFSYLLGSAEGAYNTLTEFDRSFIMVNHGSASYYVIADDLASDSAHTYSWVLNAENISQFRTIGADGSIGSLAKNKSVTDTDRFALTGLGGSVKISFDSKADISFGNWNGIGSLITVSGGEAAASDSFCAVIAPVKGNANSENVGNAVSVSESYTNDKQSGVKASYGELSDIILISKAAGVDGAGLSSDGTSASLFGLGSDGYIGYAATGAKELSYDGTKLLQASAPVSAAIYFDSSECVISGEVGTTVKLYIPEGVEGLTVGEDGYCTLTLDKERTVVTLSADGADSTEDTTASDGKEEPADNKAIVVIVIVACVVFAAGAAAGVTLVIIKKKKNKTV